MASIRMKSRATVRFMTNVAVGLLLTVLLSPGDAHAQVLGFGNPNTPYLPFVYLPTLEGEVRATALYIGLDGGRETIIRLGGSPTVWDLKDDFNMSKPMVVMDTTIRLTAGPFSCRVVYEPRGFLGVARSIYSLQSPLASARLEYSGARLGGDIDLFRWNGSRLGVDVDYDLYYPIFVEGIRTSGGFKIEGEAAMTVGVHADLNPTWLYYGMNPVFDVNFRWPVLGAQVTDFRIAAGVRFPELVLGTWVVKLGYRRTTLDFKDLSGRLEATFGGIFAELAYFY